MERTFYVVVTVDETSDFDTQYQVAEYLTEAIIGTVAQDGVLSIVGAPDAEGDS